MNLVEGEYYLVKVIKFLDIGAVVELEDHRTELVHISQISERFVTDPGNFLEIGRCYSAEAVQGKGVEADRVVLSFKYLNIAPKRPREYTGTATDSGRNRFHYRNSQNANTSCSSTESPTEGAKSLDDMIAAANKEFMDKTSRKRSSGNYRSRNRLNSKRRS